MNDLRRNQTFQHTSKVKKEQPKIPGLFNKNFKRGKGTFFVTQEIRDQRTWRKVSNLIKDMI